MRIVAGPAAIRCGTVNVAVSVFSSRRTLAVWVVPPASIVDLAEGDLRGVQRHRAGRRRRARTSIDVAPAEGRLVEVGREPQRVVLGGDARRQALGGRGDGRGSQQDDGDDNAHALTVASLSRRPHRAGLRRPGARRGTVRTARADAASARLRPRRVRPRPGRSARAGTGRRRSGRTPRRGRPALLRCPIGVDGDQLHGDGGTAPRTGGHVQQLRGGLTRGLGVEAPGALLFGGGDARGQRPHALGTAEGRRTALVGRRAGQVQSVRRVERGQRLVRLGRRRQAVPALEPQLHERVGIGGWRFDAGV